MDLRDFIKECEKHNQLKRVKKEVDWNLELSHVAKVNEEKRGPALLFEKVKGYKNSVLTSAYSTKERFAIALGLPVGTSMCEMSRHWMELATKELIKPEFVKSGPILENVDEGNNVNLNELPIPFMYPKDGGRFYGTAVYLVSKDPDTGWVNLGTYRGMVLDEKSVGLQLIKGKHAEVMLRRYGELGKKMPVLYVIGGDPLGFLTGSSPTMGQVSEYDIMGALRGEPLKVIEEEITGLPMDASAEIVVAGFVDPNSENFRMEGPFGEYTGYYSGKKSDEWPKPWIDVKRVYKRNDYIFWSTTVGKPITDTHMIQSLNRTATLWTDLETMKVPGIKSVFIPPESTGRFWAIVSLKQLYPGHAQHVMDAVMGSYTGHYGIKGIIAVDEDIPADDWNKVMWAMSTRYNPADDTQIINKGRSTPLDPSLPIYEDYMDRRAIIGRVQIDATIPFHWKRKPIEIFLDDDMKKKVLDNWEEYGID